MAPIVVKPEECRWDSLSLGEVMLRIDPGEGRIHTARHFSVWEGGGEYNVARGLRRCFGLRTGIVTALSDNPVGRLVEDFILQGGVDTSLLRWVPYDGVGRTVRNGLNFTERGFGVRAAVGCSDRGHTAISQAKPGDFDWEEIFGQRTARAGFIPEGYLRRSLTRLCSLRRRAMDAARKHGTPVSYDLNYRDSLWKSIGGKVQGAGSESRTGAKGRSAARERRRLFSDAGHCPRRRHRGFRRIARRQLRKDVARSRQRRIPT